MSRRPRVVAALAAALCLAADEGERPNGFDLSRASVPPGSIVKGGPPRDGIPRVDEPRFATADAATWVLPTNTVLGVSISGDARAYPVHLLEYHQVVNDVVGGVPVVVTYDPIAGVPRAFRREVGGRVLRFGVSGLIHNANFLLYDLETESLWSQFLGQAIAGELAGRALERVGVRQEALAVWLARHPGSRVLERPEPYRIDYRYSPYKAYWVSETIPFPVAAQDARYHPKELVVGVVVDGRARAYLGSALTAAGGRALDEIAGKRLRIDYDTNLAAFSWEVPEGVDVTEAYWFAWKAFHPETEVWEPPARPPAAAGAEGPGRWGSPPKPPPPR
jgi:hypothetical protein